MFSSVLVLSCTPTKELDSAVLGYQYPSPTDMPALRGSGGPNQSFAEEDLWSHCSPLYGGSEDGLHHNLVVPYRGHLVMPWIPEWGRGGVSFFNFSDPCSPQKEAEFYHDRLRESHALGFAYLPEDDPNAGEYLVLTGILGLQFWEISNLENMEMLNYMEISGVFYPDSYTRVVLSVFWQYPYVYVGASDNGVFVVDATNPREPELVTQYLFDPPMRSAAVFAVGNTLFVSSAEGSDAALLDISDPRDPQPIGGGRFQTKIADGTPKEAYHANVAGPWALFARKEDGGGVIIYDISNPSEPTYVQDVFTQGGNGGYVFYDEGHLFLGDSHWAKVFDAQDFDNITEIGTGYLTGDLDTITPYGNVAILSVDDDATDGVASVVMPWNKEIDTAGPIPLYINPNSDAENIPLTARIGISFNEMIEPTSAFPGSIRLIDSTGNNIEGWAGAQENIAYFTPKSPLSPNETYTIQVLAGGIRDVNNNAVETTIEQRFSTLGN